MARGQNLLNKVYNKPLLITMSDLQPIADYLSSPERVASLKFEKDDLASPKLEDYSFENEYQKAVMKYLDINPETMTGTLNIDGVLVNREGSMNSECVELTSYQGLKKRFEMQVEQGIKSCILMISSGGGEAFGAWSTASYVKKVAQQNNIKLTAYVNGNACSAAYVWAAVADEVVSHPMGQSGSIGVLVQLYNDSKMLDTIGIQRSFVYAGGNKIPFDKEGSFTDKFIADLQTSVDKTYSKFVQHVSLNRGLTEQQVIDTQASVFDADEALELGLVDKIMELEDFELQYGLKKSANKDLSFSGMAMMEGNNQSMKEGTMKNSEKEAPQTDELLSNAHVTNQGLEDMSKDLTSQLAEFKLVNEDLTSQLSALLEKLNASEDKVAELTSAMQKTELEHRTAQRQAKLEDALGKDNEGIAELLSNTESLSDAQFETVAKSLASTQVEKQEQLQEFGGEGQEAEEQLSLAEQIKAKAQTMYNRKA